MTSGRPDWRAPGLGAGGRLFLYVNPGLPQDIIADPGAGNRIVLYYCLTLDTTSAAIATADEVTVGNVFVRTLLRAGGIIGKSDFMDWGGVPLAAGNHLRNTAGTTSRLYNVVYVIEAV